MDDAAVLGGGLIYVEPFMLGTYSDKSSIRSYSYIFRYRLESRV